MHCRIFCSERPAGNGDAPTELNDADISSNWDEAIETFDGMDLPEELLRGIYSYGFEKPSAIQQRAIKPAILGRDLIAQAQSGTVSFTSLASPFLSKSATGRKNYHTYHLSSLKRVILYVSENFKLKIGPGHRQSHKEQQTHAITRFFSPSLLST